MKTNVNMVRKLKDFDVVQRTKDGYFNATALLKQWNGANNLKKEVADFFKLEQTKSFLEVLVDQENLHTGDSPYVKSRASRGLNAGTWMHPYLFVKFAMWLNPKFEYFVIKFVYDQLIECRHQAGDNYTMLCTALAKFPDVVWREVGMALNFVAFNDHRNGKRNTVTPEEMKVLKDLERDMTRAIEMGFINSFKEFKNVLRREWRRRHTAMPICLT